MKAALITVLAMVVGSALSAGLIGSTTLPQLVNSAEVIVVGDITASPAAVPGTSTVQIMRVIKGNPSEGTVTFRWPRELLDFRDTRNVHGLLFLEADSPEGWVAVAAVPG